MVQQQQDVLGEVVKRINDNTRRIRILEERFRDLETRILGVEKLVLDNHKEFNDLSGQFSRDLASTRDKLVNLEVDIQNFKRDSKKLVAKSEVKELENYISLISPILTKFVTRKELEEVIAQKMK